MLLSGQLYPARAMDWLPSAGPEGGQVWTLAQAPNGDIYAGIWWGGGALRSTDLGVTWQETGLSYTNVSKIVVNNAGTVFAALSYGEVHRSTDNGTSWEISGSNLTFTFGSLAYDPDLDILYAAKSEKFSRSVNGGNSWETVGTNFPLVDVQCLEAVPNGGSLFVGTVNNKVYRSDDGGVTWNPYDSGLTTKGVTDFLVVPEGDIYAASYGGGIFRAALNDNFWTQLNNGLDDGYCFAIVRDPAGNLWAGTASSGTYMSTDDGQNWNPARAGLEIREVRDILRPVGGELLAACYGGGVFRGGGFGFWVPSNAGMIRTHITSLLKSGIGPIFATANGAGIHRSLDEGLTWSPANTGIEDPGVLDITDHPDGDLFCGTWTTRIYHSVNGGDTWNPTASFPDIERVACLAAKSGTGDLFAGGLFSGGVWRSPDMGNSWVPAIVGLPDAGTRDLVVEDDGGLLVVMEGEGIYRSVDDGNSWTSLNNGLTSLYVNQVLSLPGGILFAAVPYEGLFRSLDDGANWELVDASLDDTRVSSVVVNPNGFLFAGTSEEGRLYQSTDGGDSWFQVSGLFPQVSIRNLAFNADGFLLAGTGGRGVILTDETTPVFLHGLVAERAGSGTVTIRWSVRDVGSLLAGEIHRSVAGSEREHLSSVRLADGPFFEFVDETAPPDPCDYWLRLTDASGNHSWYGPVSVDKADLAVVGLTIEAVWPNPAAGSTTIRFAVPPNETARLDVYDLRGRLVRRLRQDASGSGALEVVWDTCDDRGVRVASGTYFLRLSSQSRVVTEKTIVLGRQR